MFIYEGIVNDCETVPSATERPDLTLAVRIKLKTRNVTE
jgi:hypothetical protein